MGAVHLNNIRHVKVVNTVVNDRAKGFISGKIAITRVGMLYDGTEL
jgi:hypothetical protein